MCVIPRSPVWFRPKPRELRCTWIWSIRPSSKGSKLLNAISPPCGRLSRFSTVVRDVSTAHLMHILYINQLRLSPSACGHDVVARCSPAVWRVRAQCACLQICVHKLHQWPLAPPLWILLRTKRDIGSIGIEQSNPMFVETNSNSIDGQTRPLASKDSNAPHSKNFGKKWKKFDYLNIRCEKKLMMIAASNAINWMRWKAMPCSQLCHTCFVTTHTTPTLPVLKAPWK